MGSGARRTFFAVGIALLVVGWTMTRYAEVRQSVVSDGRTEPVGMWTGERQRVKSWVDDTPFLPGRTLYLVAAAGMGLGALITVLAWPRAGG